MNFYPMKLRGVCKSALWGGRKLITEYGKASGAESVAESWELTVRDGEVSVIQNGEYAGEHLDRLLSRFPAAVGTDVCGGFPLLIKLIDAARDLSIQVHPDNDYAALHENDSGKSELWYIIDATPGARIIYGTKDGVDDGELKNALTRGEYDRVLRHVEVHAGDSFYIPSGQIHALCGGILIAEIQQSSDLTYRIYDYGRVGADGAPRELHTEKALEVSRSYTSADIKAMQLSRRAGRRCAPTVGRLLADCEHFRVCEFSSDASFTIDEKAFGTLIFTFADNATVSGNGVCVDAAAGDTFFLPAGMGCVEIGGSFRALFAEI